MAAIYKKELKSYFRNVTGFIFMAFMMAVIGFYAAIINFSYASPEFGSVLYSASFIFLIIVPIITMKSVADERHQKTDRLLYSLPIDVSQIVLGKYFAMLTIFAIPVALSCAYPAILSMYDPSGCVSLGSCYGTILAFFLLGAALIAVGLFVSSLTENVIISAVFCLGAMIASYLVQYVTDKLPTSSNASFIGTFIIILLLCALVFFLTKNKNAVWIAFIVCVVPLTVIRLVKSELLEGLLKTVVGSISLFSRLYSFASGVFDVKAVVYLISVAALFVFFTVQSMEKRRWS